MGVPRGRVKLITFTVKRAQVLDVENRKNGYFTDIRRVETYTLIDIFQDRCSRLEKSF